MAGQTNNNNKNNNNREPCTAMAKMRISVEKFELG